MTRDEANATARALFAGSCAADNICHTGPCACIADVAAALIAAHDGALEEAADIVVAEDRRVLACQKPGVTPGTFEDSVNAKIRLTTVLLSNIAAAIRARKIAP